ncbi:hypothetical protein SpCBS45565_g00779 [Spizellomyces sp. 'palustris']|nr:hypothetical protein SpCBS45565_g00779 [Spizellomyces sp. 'palustris']
MSEVRQRPVKSTEDKVSPEAPSTVKKVPPTPTRAVIPPAVIAKLLIFSFLLFFLPIATYFYTLRTIFNGNSNYSAMAAVIVANLVVFAYVVVAFLEDQGETPDGGGGAVKKE